MRIHQKGKYCAGPNCDCRRPCQNSNTKGRAILAPGCMGSAAEEVVLISYAPRDEGERQRLELCRTCAEAIARDASRHGYGVEVKPWK